MKTIAQATTNLRIGRVAVRLVLATVIALAAIAAGVALWRPEAKKSDQDHSATEPSNPTDGSDNSVDIAPPERSKSAYRNTEPGVEYIGSDACRDCHEHQFDAYANTPHSRSLNPVESESHLPDGLFRHALSGRSFQVKRNMQDQTVIHSEFIGATEDDRTVLSQHPVKYQMGSGHVARSFLVEDDGFLIQSPVTWFEGRQCWDMSPGYDSAQHLSFARVIRSGCLFCHAGHVEAPEKNGFRHRIKELSIGCERCHGPGNLHVRRRLDSSTDDSVPDLSIVNPRGLSRELSEAVCAQCHLNGDIQATVRGRNAHDFRPGLPLQEYRLEFRITEPGDKIRVAGHVEQLRASLCYQKDASLTCITCHNPHPGLGSAEGLHDQRAKCVSCHQQQPCGLTLSRRQNQNGDNCIQCHMPKMDTEVTHVALTQHRIGVYSDEVTADDGSDKQHTEFLTPLQSLDHLSKADRHRSVGLAMLGVVRIAGNSPEQIKHLKTAASLLYDAFRLGLRDPELLTALAGIARDFEDVPRGIELAESALKAPYLSLEIRLTATDILAELSFRRGQFDIAQQHLQLITRNHRSAFHWFLSGQILSQQRNSAEAETAFREAVRLDPGNSQYRTALASVLQKSGMRDEALMHQRMAESLK